ncbi:hypothetical protein C0992_002474 [Termitomyces sp. T32_za158]|nr:hypothetical protein C0992_002474 [Termitomyces sp. T32_za158]
MTCTESTFPRIDMPEEDEAFGPPLGSIPRNPNYERHTPQSMNAHLSAKTSQEIYRIMKFASHHHADEEMFLIFDFVAAQQPLEHDTLEKWIEMFPPLAFTLMKRFIPQEDNALPEPIAGMAHTICRNIIRCANSLGIASLVAIEKMARSIADMDVEQYFDLLNLAAHSVRSHHLVQEVLLCLNDARLNSASNPFTQAMEHGHKFALSIAFDRADDAADECPCDDNGKPRKQRTSPSHVKLSSIADEPDHVRATVRVDAKTEVRLHSHVRLQAASKATNRWMQAPIMDGLVVQASKGELKISLLHTQPPEMELMDWNMYHAGITATSKAMMDAVLRLLQEGQECCNFHDIITGSKSETATEGEPGAVPIASSSAIEPPVNGRLNQSQIEAVKSCDVPLSLIWGPPGTGKTTVVVEILQELLKKSGNDDPPKILMTASTHNAVDNVLERFVAVNATKHLLPEEKILRVATDQSKVNENLKGYTVDARVGGDTNENNKLAKKAQERVKAAVLVFTTCAGMANNESPNLVLTK